MEMQVLLSNSCLLVPHLLDRNLHLPSCHLFFSLQIKYNYHNYYISVISYIFICWYIKITLRRKIIILNYRITPNSPYIKNNSTIFRLYVQK
ncbi:hypothetical protein FGO68_gene2606 [Halteria grandinella]|uniref:Uncharacterized protein n=1 Tax=Halteria grandinella TaxID=5974 RepID=A0A8J8NWD4_HALGN|nr:hypothetical protein FGO68_gene2606 [Halteria grandinella]